MAVHVKCSRPYNIQALKAIIERCGGRGPSPPRCPPMNKSSDHLESAQPISSQNASIPSNSGSPGLHSRNSHRYDSPRRSACPSPKPCPISCCMNCPPMAPIPPCPPCPFVCPTCTGYPCVNCAPLPKPVPASREIPRPVVRTQLNSGGLLYTGTMISYPCPPPCSPPPKCLPCTPIPGIVVSC